MPPIVHPTAEVSQSAVIGDNVRVWHHAQIREDAHIGDNCIVGKNVYIDRGVKIGSNVKIQNNAAVYAGATIEDGVFIGPGACLTNDKVPRAIDPDGMLKQADDWDEGAILVRYGASIGAGAVIVTDVSIGRFAMVGASALVTRSVPDHGLVLGSPARLVGYVCACGHRLLSAQASADGTHFHCAHCGRKYHQGWSGPLQP